MPGDARIGQERPGEARRGHERQGDARGGQERPGEARRCQEMPGEATRCKERPAEARRGQKEMLPDVFAFAVCSVMMVLTDARRRNERKSHEYLDCIRITHTCLSGRS